jgi:uncharacterized protein (TIGR03435 family)
MKLWTPSTTLVLCWVAFGQEPVIQNPAGQQQAVKPAFEVASVKPAQPMPMGQMRISMSADAGMLRYTNVPLKDVIRVAYRVKEFQVQGPDWIGRTHFDIVAKLPDGASKDQIPEMLQALLADRFKMTAHRDTKEHAIYAMVVVKGGPKLKPAGEEAGPLGGRDGNPGNSGMPPRGNMMMQVDGAGAHLKAPAATLANLAEMLSRFSERPVVDLTGIQGQYDFDLVFSPETMGGMPGGRPGPMQPPGGEQHPAADAPAESAGSIYESVQRYGLKLEPRKAAMEVVIVDQIENTPTGN